MVNSNFKAWLELFWKKESKKMLSALKGMGGDGAAYDDDWIDSLSRSIGDDQAEKYGREKGLKVDLHLRKQAVDFMYGKLSRMDLGEAVAMAEAAIRDGDFYWPAALYKIFKKQMKKKKYWWAFAPFYGKGAGYPSQATSPPGKIVGSDASQVYGNVPASGAKPGAGGINAPGVAAGPNAGMGPISASKVFQGSSMVEAYEFMKMKFLYESKKILVVDDTEMLADLVATSLEVAGAKVTTFYDPKKAIAELESGAKYDIVCTDFRMPGKTGDDVMKVAKKMGAKVVLISGTIEDTKHPQEYDMIIEKPAGLKMLKKVVGL